MKKDVFIKVLEGKEIVYTAESELTNVSLCKAIKELDKFLVVEEGPLSIVISNSKVLMVRN